MTIRNLTFVSCLLCFCCLGTAQAEMASYWIVGSFPQQSSAVKEKTRLEGISDFQIRIVSALANGRETFRLATRQADTARERTQQKGLLIAAKVHRPWTLKLDLDTNDKGTPPTTQPPAMQDRKLVYSTPQESVTTLVQVPKTSHPPLSRTKKEYFEYCMNKASGEERTLYCGNDKLGRSAMFGH